MTYYICQVANSDLPQPEYFFYTDQGHWSSNFHSLEQLCDVGLQDPDIQYSRLNYIQALIAAASDLTLLFEAPTLDFDYMLEYFPEHFI